MKPKTTIVLVALLVICVGYVVVRHTDLFRPPKPVEPVRKVLRPAPAEARQLTIVSAAEKRKIVFARRDDVWRIVEPVQGKADGWQVNDLLRTFRDLEYSRVLEKDDKDAEASLTGLDHPRWTVTLVDEKDASHVIEVGKTVPLRADQTYVRRSRDDRVYVAEADLAAKLVRPVHEYRDKDVFELQAADVVRLAVEGGQRPFVAAKTDGDWGLLEPVSARADQDKLRELVNRALNLRVSEFVRDRTEQLGEFGLDRPPRTVRIWVKPPPPTTVPTTASAPTTVPAEAQPKQYVLKLGRKVDQKVYAQLEGQPEVFTVAADLLDDLQPEILALRDKQILAAESFQVDRVDLDLPSGQAVLVREDFHWKMVEPFAGRANYAEVSDLLSKIDSLRATGFKDKVDAAGLAGFGLAQPRGKITLHIAGTGKTRTLLIGSKSSSEAMTYVMPADSTSVTVVDSADADRVLADPATYWHTTLLKLPAGEEIRELLVQRKDATFHLKRDGDAWSMSKPLAANAETENVKKILDRLRTLTADKIVALAKDVKDLPEDYRRPDARIVVGITTVSQAASQPTTAATQPATATTTRPAATKPAAKTATYFLRVVKVLGKVYAWVSERKVLAVGECPQSLFDDLMQELRSRTVLKINADDVQGVHILAGDDSLELVRQRTDEKDHWRSVTDPDVKIDPAKVRSYLDEMEEVRVEKFASHSSLEAAKYGLAQPWVTLKLTMTKDKVVQLDLSPRGEEGSTSRYATAKGVEGVFVLSGDTVGKLAKKLDDFKD